MMGTQGVLRCVPCSFYGPKASMISHRVLFRRRCLSTAIRGREIPRPIYDFRYVSAISNNFPSWHSPRPTYTYNYGRVGSVCRKQLHSTNCLHSTKPASALGSSDKKVAYVDSSICSDTLEDNSANKVTYVDTGCVVYNSRTRTKTPLTRQAHSSLSWYMCGPTVYDSMHLGHAVTYIRFDVVRRILSDYCGVPVCQVMGITDIDDKIITRAEERRISVKSLAENYEREFLEDLILLGCLPPTCTARVSDHLPEIITFIKGLEDRGYAYRLTDDRERVSIYFDVGKYGDRYGALAPERAQNNLTTKKEVVDEEVVPTKANKRDARDFALWKAADNTDGVSIVGDVSWESPWGSGRPGWHIECSAMSCHILGDHLDLHTGGIDLKFPHHENEIAQCEALHNHTWAQCFLHTGHLHIEGLKMSKSLKNFTTVRDFLGIKDDSDNLSSPAAVDIDSRKGEMIFAPQQLRLACLMTKYNAPMHYSDNLMTQALNIENRFRTFFSDADEFHAKNSSSKWSAADTQLMKELESIRFTIDDKLRDDFDTPGTMHRLLDMVTTTNKHMSADRTQAATASVLAVRDYIDSILSMMGVQMQQTRNIDSSVNQSRVSTEEVVDHFVDFRSNVRDKALSALKSIKKNSRTDETTKEKLTEEMLTVLKSILTSCDGLRNEVLPSLGVSLKDSAAGSKWRFGQLNVPTLSPKTKGTTTDTKQ
ncbi:hypothetical protein SARC_05396 [Sphaeroforma arctica JP610]|uniref:cysteine--tRNA ligase n=1 Tax=Sphaeroforma arctica JP610 TaxID=667725 RepID=A0A0L0G0C5_9EUKA|nr:hypothetical protein SARC_05396 [Sphaeroforma arctica JP610]KNC82304.1 hypothetical protein SARC_05396 [Sphaeroforma arctica JP610]|eukprot:XP_014156206.1 hypothetical protein SARC_05396 [Sphaeroforma arctica JP610]